MLKHTTPKKKFCLRGAGFILALVMIIFGISPAHADLDLIDMPQDDEYFKAEVLEVLPSNDSDGVTDLYQQIRVRALDGSFKDREVIVTQEAVKGYRILRDIHEGETIVAYYSPLNEPAFIVDSAYRLPNIGFLILAFFILVLVFTGWHGVRALLGLTLSLLIIIYFIVPQIANGGNPVTVSIIGSVFILISAMFLSHGLNMRSTIAFVSTFGTILVSAFLGWAAISYTKLLGIGSDEAFFLQFGNLATIDLKGLLLGGIIISTIGLLDDVSIVQATTVEELHKADSTLSQKELYKRGLVVGKEHIVSMVNTLFIVYAGAALPLFLFFNFSGTTGIPLWVHLNHEMLTEEIVRSIVGSMVLICTVPVTTYISAYVYSKQNAHAKK